MHKQKPKISNHGNQANSSKSVLNAKSAMQPLSIYYLPQSVMKNKKWRQYYFIVSVRF